MKVCEIYRGIQGESSHAGMPCTFVRLAGCNLRCAYCDTTYAYHEGREMSEEEVIGEVSRTDSPLVELTGGEPLLQAGVPGLITRLIDGGRKVLVETNGSLSIRDLDQRATVVMDIKTPGSGMSGEMDLRNLECLKPSDEVKFVLMDRADYEWAREFTRRHELAARCGVLFSPVFGVLSPGKLSAWMLHDRLPARLNLQLHKYIFGPERRGV